jgi:hypothetical protein
MHLRDNIINEDTLARCVEGLFFLPFFRSLLHPLVVGLPPPQVKGNTNTHVTHSLTHSLTHSYKEGHPTRRTEHKMTSSSSSQQNPTHRNHPLTLPALVCVKQAIGLTFTGRTLMVTRSRSLMVTRSLILRPET